MFMSYVWVGYVSHQCNALYQLKRVLIISEVFGLPVKEVRIPYTYEHVKHIKNFESMPMQLSDLA